MMSAGIAALRWPSRVSNSGAILTRVNVERVLQHLQGESTRLGHDMKALQ